MIFIKAALSKNWNTEILSQPTSGDYYSPHWIIHTYYYRSSDIVDILQEYLRKYGFVGFSLFGGLEHGVVICHTDCGDVIADSYLQTRQAGFRKLTDSFWLDLRDLIIEPTLDKWNRLWQCQEKPGDIFGSEIITFFEIDYHDTTIKSTRYTYQRCHNHEEITINFSDSEYVIMPLDPSKLGSSD